MDGIAGEADNLALAEIELPGMLMMRYYSGCRRAGIFRKKDERLYTLRFFYRILQRSGVHTRHNPPHSKVLDSEDSAGWYRILSEALRHYLHGRQLEPPIRLNPA